MLERLLLPEVLLNSSSTEAVWVGATLKGVLHSRRTQFVTSHLHSVDFRGSDTGVVLTSRSEGPGVNSELS